jgi:arginine decarboxylase
MNAIYLPKYNKENHCTSGFLIQVLIRKQLADMDYQLIPQPKHILINRDENGIIATEVFSEQQTSDDENFRLRQKNK